VFTISVRTIAALSWISVLLFQETGVSVENYRPSTSHWQTLSCKLQPWAGLRKRNDEYHCN